MRVLCIDDNRDLADSIGLLLQLVGFEARVCYDGQQAIRLAQEFDPHICLIDLQMPGMSGDDVARALDSQFGEKKPYLIAVTAMGGDLHRILTRKAGFQKHLVKPVPPFELISLLNALRPEIQKERNA
jgi:DNA-binding response OmpR family regulator